MRREDVDSCLVSAPRGRIDVPLRVDRHSVDAPPRREVVQNALVRYAPVAQDVVGIQSLVATFFIIIVRKIEGLVVGRDQNAVGALHIVQDSSDLAAGVDAIDRLLVLLHSFPVAVSRVGEVDVASAVEVQVVGAVEPLAVVTVRQCDHPAVLFGARYPAPAVRGVSLARQQAALSVKLEPIGAAARFAKNTDSAACRVVNHDAVIRDVGEENISIVIHYRAFGEAKAGRYLLNDRSAGNESCVFMSLWRDKRPPPWRQGAKNDKGFSQ